MFAKINTNNNNNISEGLNRMKKEILRNKDCLCVYQFFIFNYQHSCIGRFIMRYSINFFYIKVNYDRFEILIYKEEFISKAKYLSTLHMLLFD